MTAYPVRLEGTLDPQLSRWLWIVKMFLAIPHYLILVGLTTALILTTLIARAASRAGSPA